MRLALLTCLLFATTVQQTSKTPPPLPDPHCFRSLDEFCATDKCFNYAAQVDALRGKDLQRNWGHRGRVRVLSGHAPIGRVHFGHALLRQGWQAGCGANHQRPRHRQSYLSDLDTLRCRTQVQSGPLHTTLPHGRRRSVKGIL